jgi:hypothetical protein
MTWAVLLMRHDLGRVCRVQAKPLRSRVAGLDLAAAGPRDGSYEEDGGGRVGGIENPRASGHRRAISLGDEGSLTVTHGSAAPQVRPCTGPNGINSQADTGKCSRPRSSGSRMER